MLIPPHARQGNPEDTSSSTTGPVNSESASAPNSGGDTAASQGATGAAGGSA